MNSLINILLRAALLTLFATTGYAQDDVPAETGVEAAEAEAASPAEPALLAVKPRSSEIAPQSSRSLLLGITRAGDQLVAVGDRGNILLSRDGKTWEQVVAPVNVTLTAVAFADARHGWAVGHDAAILHTTDAGKTWKLQNFNSQENKALFNIFPLDAQHAYAMGAYGLLLETRDGGTSWTQVDAGPVTADGLHINAMIRLGNGELFVAGEIGLVGVYGIDAKAAAAAEAKARAQARAQARTQAAARTTAGAVPAPTAVIAAPAPVAPSWQRLSLPYEGSLFGALPRGEKGALVYGLRGNVYVTDDVHANQWTQIDIGSKQSIFGGALMDNGDVALAGADGALLIIKTDGTVQGGLTAKAETDLASGTLSGVLPWNGSLLVVGDLGVNRVPVGQ